ncbi:hypothetical protein [Aeromicrobium ginsengisoli]|uniref:Uncharacterized protein n=1 Tax=Aeromicrobium ginsengisoli TaxID=363867 RepID=A0A5M4FGJ6_9ACTN|nr:hypothetical protein [Aeromicrobium ginsengisoli]KAA1399200.1 hypothetical protein ESP70_000005 [Aeromicrobium ginsengisoli]
MIRDYVTSRLLAALVFLTPLSIWAFAPSDENDFTWSGTVYAAAGAGVAFALAAALSARWVTRIPVVAAGLGWLACLGVLVFDELFYDGMVGIGDGLVALLGTVVAATSTVVALFTPLRSSQD